LDIEERMTMMMMMMMNKHYLIEKNLILLMGEYDQYERF
jgi:hypothetical protein